MSPLILAAFPKLIGDDPAILESPNPAYNCVAWLVGDVDSWWWPADRDAFWPAAAPDELTVAAFEAALATVGFARCATGSLEAGFLKAAIYAQADLPTHVARQMPDGRWSSKLGRDSLISHATTVGLEGVVYGVVVAYLRRPNT